MTCSAKTKEWMGQSWGCIDTGLVLHKICPFSSIMKVKGRTTFRNGFLSYINIFILCLLAQYTKIHYESKSSKASFNELSLIIL